MVPNLSYKQTSFPGLTASNGSPGQIHQDRCCRLDMKWVLERPSLVNQITRHLRGELQSGAWSARLPGEHTLCATFNVSRVTVRAALKKLEAEGLLKCRRGSS